jgi:hypothetical protein
MSARSSVSSGEARAAAISSGSAGAASIAVVPWKRVDRSRYADLCDAATTTTIFHSPEFMRIFDEFGVDHSMIVSEDSHGLLAALPVTSFSMFGARALFSSGFSTYGGPIVRPGHESVVAELLARFAAMTRDPRVVLASLQDFHGTSGRLAELGFKHTEASTLMLQLPEKFELLVKSSKLNASELGRAARSGVRIGPSTDLHEFREWRSLCSRNYIGHGRRPYPPEFFAALERLIASTSTFRFFSAVLAGKVVGGIVAVFGRREVFYLMSAIDKDLRVPGVNDGVLSEVLRASIDAGCKSFDFGATPPDAHGLINFKRKWGGTSYRYATYVKSNWIGRFGAIWVRQRPRLRLGRGK